MGRQLGRLALVLSAWSLSACDGGSLLTGSDGAPLNAQIVHPGGTVLQLLSIKADNDRVLVTVRTMNARAREIVLNSGRENSYILTESGEKLFLVPPAGNPTLAVPSGQTMDGALVFGGKLGRSARASMVLNENGSVDSLYTSSPRFQLAMPLEGAFGASGIPESSALSGMRPNAASSLRPASATQSRLGSAAQATSDLKVVEALRSELGAVQTDRGTVVSLSGDVTFDFDKATIRDNAKGTLNRLAELIQAGGTGAITIEGHTDAKGDDAYNKRLSEERANSVKAFLASKGVDESRLSTIGLGELRAVAPNAKPDGSDDEAGRERNRRVEVILPNANSAAQAEQRPDREGSNPS